MKLLKKVLAVTTVLTLALSAVPASAATDAIDFEDGKVPSSILMKTDDGGDVSELSVVDYNDSKQLFVDVKEGVTLVPKLQINVPELVGAANLDKVRTLQFDLTIVSPKGEPVAWNGGGTGANIGADGKVWYQDPAGWTIEEYENAEASTKIKVTFVKGMGFTKDVADSSYLFMKWAGNDCDMYLDNIQFLDADGNPVALVSGTSDAAAEDTKEASDDAAVTDTAADTATTTTDVPKTGSDSYALFFLAGAAIMLTGSVVIKRRKSVEE